VTGTQQRVLEVLARHLSSINAHNVLARALRDSRLAGPSLTSEEVRRLQPALERGLRLFLPLAAVGEVLTELSRTFAPAEPPRAQQVAIREEADISEARLAAWAMCEALGARRILTQKVATVVSELARNIFMYTGGGVIELIPLAGGHPRPHLLVLAVDDGPGIGNLEEILAGRYRSRTGLGAGLLGTKRLVDRFAIQTAPTGTRIEAEVLL
jgi:serine/threonine-protein kinase RsbT